MNKFKVGDKVIAYGNGKGQTPVKLKGYITEINNEIVYIKSNNGISAVTHYKQCRKLVKKCKHKFKVGDRVQIINSWDICQIVDIYFSKYRNCYDYYIKYNDGSSTWKSEQDILYKYEDFSTKISNTIYNHFVDKINLNKKKSKFKVGDRVVAITIAGNKYKGTIVEIIDTTYCNYYDVKFDNKNLISIIPFPTNQLKKLRKKNIEFKFGDRVNAYNDDGLFIDKATIIASNVFYKKFCDSNVSIIFDDGQEGRWKDKYLKKLKKKCKIK